VEEEYGLFEEEEEEGAQDNRGEDEDGGDTRGKDGTAEIGQFKYKRLRAKMQLLAAV
jgi:hypothetical protein